MYLSIFDVILDQFKENKPEDIKMSTFLSTSLYPLRDFG